MPLASIPSPGCAVWHLGPLSVRAYALCVIAGIVVAVAVASRRYRRSGVQTTARPGVILDVAAWAIPFGLAGALVHTILLDNRRAFGDEYRLWHAATVGVAAIGVPGAVALGAAGAGSACARRGGGGRGRWVDRLPPVWRRLRAGIGRGRARAGVRPGRRGPG